MKRNNLLSLALISSSLISFYIITATTAAHNSALIYLHEEEPVRSAGNNTLNRLTNSGNTIVVFYEDWCPPCKRMTPIFEELAREMHDVMFVKVKREFYRNIYDQYKLTSVPAILFFRNGQLVKIQPSSASKSEMIKLINKIYGK